MGRPNAWGTQLLRQLGSYMASNSIFLLPGQIAANFMAAALPRSERRAGGYAGPRGAGLCCRIGVRGTCVAGEDKPPSITERK